MPAYIAYSRCSTEGGQRAGFRTDLQLLMPFLLPKMGLQKNIFIFLKKKCAKYLHSIWSVLIFVLSNKEIKSHLKFKIMKRRAVCSGTVYEQAGLAESLTFKLIFLL